MRVRTNTLRNIVASYWQPAVFYGMLIVFFGLLLWFRLGILVGGYSADELATLQASDNVRSILEHPINAPFTLLTYLFGLVHFGDQPLFPLRAAATAYGLLTLTTFYWLVRHWHGERTAILGTIIFGCSAWFLHTARLGTPEMLLCLPLALTAGSVWLKHTDNRLILLAGFALIAVLLYIPGMVWLLVAGSIWQGKRIFRLFKQHWGFMTAGGTILLVLASPLVWAIYRSPELAKVVAGLPAKGWPDAWQSLHRLADVPYNLLVRGPLDAQHWLGRLPLLDAFSIAMVLLGLYVYIRHWRLERSKLVGAILVIGTLLVALGGAVGLPILLPCIYLLIAAGIGFMMDRWYTVFPRNAIAQGVSVVLISLAVIASSWYGLRHYFVAWPSAPATKTVFTVDQAH